MKSKISILLFVFVSTVFIFLCANTISFAKISSVLLWQAGTLGSGTNQYNYPSDVSFDSFNNIYVADTSNHRVVKLNSDGDWQWSVGTYGTGINQFQSPGSLTLDGSGNIFVADSYNNRIVKLNSSGVWQWSVGTYGAGVNQFDHPFGISLDSVGNIFVSDSYNSRIVKLNSSGVWQTTYGTTRGGGVDQFYYPNSITLDSSDNIYIADGLNNRVVKLNSSGVWQWSFATRDGDNNLFRPFGIDVDSGGNIYVSNLFTCKIDIFDSTGVWQRSIGSYGSGPDQFYNQNGIRIDGNGDLIVADAQNNRIVKRNPNVVLFQIANLDGGTLDVVAQDGSVKVGSTIGYSTSSIPVTLRYLGLPISDLSVDFTAGSGSDLNWTNVNAGTDLVSGKAFVFSLNPTDAPGASSTHTLYIPKLDGQTGTYLCPTANDLSEVYVGCPGGYVLNEGDPAVTIVNIGGQDYWLVSGLTGTGGLGVSSLALAEPFILTPNSSNTITNQDVVITYTPSLGFVSGDKVQFHFEPTAGFVLANTCATPTTDANGDTTVDGSGAIVGSDVYEYTFSNAVPTGELAFCVNVTSPATAGSYSVRLTDDNGSFGNSMYYVGGDNEVFVIANVAPSLSFNIRTLADDADTNVCSFGTVSPSDTLPNYDNVDDGASECGYALAVGTNAANGFQVQITADDQLNGTSGNIADISNGGTFSSGVESYGLANVTSSTSGRNVTTGGYTESILRNGNFNLGANTGTNIPLSATNFVSYTNGIQYVAGVDSLDTTSVVHGLVIGSGTPAGYYDQVLTYTTTANF